MRLAKEGFGTILLVAAITLPLPIYWFVISTGAQAPDVTGISLLDVLKISITILLLGVFLLVVYFFRDPERVSPEGQGLILSPADGKVVEILTVHEPAYLKEEAVQISIFLSPLNVHVNRVPADGVIEYLEYFPGKYLMAWDPKASIENERAEFGLKHATGARLLFRQITGFLARRIEYHLQQGDVVKAGDRFGIMKFGSRMDVLLPKGTAVLVKEGAVVEAGTTLLAKLG